MPTLELTLFIISTTITIINEETLSKSVDRRHDANDPLNYIIKSKPRVVIERNKYMIRIYEINQEEYDFLRAIYFETISPSTPLLLEYITAQLCSLEPYAP